METIACKALVAFTQFVPGYGQVHGDPESSDEAARNPKVPVHYVDLIAANGGVEAPEGFVYDPEPAEHAQLEPEPESAPAADEKPGKAGRVKPDTGAPA